MNKLSTHIENYQRNLFTILYEALLTHSISEERAGLLNIQIQQLSLKLVEKFNHGRSTSLSKDDYLHIMDTINVLSLQGLEEDFRYSRFNEVSIEELFEVGVRLNQQKVIEIKQLCERISRHQLPISNELYHDLLKFKLPRITQSLEGEDAIFYYCYVIEDLDYPLVDGLPIQFEMYHLKGCDLLMTYLKRLLIENEFCYAFKEDLPQLTSQYQRLKGIAFEESNLNVFELVMNQAIAYHLLFGEFGLLLSEVDIQRLKAYLSKKDKRKEIEMVINELKHNFNTEIFEYMECYKELFIHQFTLFTHEDIDLLIYEIDQADEFMVYLKRELTSKQLIRINENLQRLNEPQKKITYLQQLKINVLDLIDLLESDVFYDEEYVVYYASLSPLELAILLKTTYPELVIFQQRLQVESLQESILSIQYDWQKYFIDYLKDYPQLGEVDHLVHRIELCTLF